MVLYGDDIYCIHFIDYFFLLTARNLLYISDRIVHTMAFGTTVGEHWLDCEIAQWVHHEDLIPLADDLPWSYTHR